MMIRNGAECSLTSPDREILMIRFRLGDYNPLQCISGFLSGPQKVWRIIRGVMKGVHKAYDES